MKSLEVLDDCISSLCCKNGVGKSFVLEQTNNVQVNIEERIDCLANYLCANKYTGFLLSPNVKNVLHNKHEDLVIVTTDKTTAIMNIIF